MSLHTQPTESGGQVALHDDRVETDLALYTRTAQESAAQVIRRYSTSFAASVRLLAPEYRTDITSIYALVRVADELVDGAAEQAGLGAQAQAAALDSLEAETDRAIACGFSANLVVHAFACAARRAGIRRDLTAPFFASMRADLTTASYEGPALGEYIYGSAEVVGLMCLRVFLAEAPDSERRDPATRARLVEGARRLGAALQKVNFLRDLASDREARGRQYLDGVTGGELTENAKRAAVTEIADDLAAAAETIPYLPSGCRAAVTAAHDLFAALNRRIDETPAAELMHTRVHVPNAQKVAIVARAAAVKHPRVAK